MAEDPFEQAEAIERDSTLVIVVVSIIAVALTLSGVVGGIGSGLGLGEGIAIFGFAVVVNAALVAYQVSAGKRINILCKRPYI